MVAPLANASAVLDRESLAGALLVLTSTLREAPLLPRVPEPLAQVLAPLANLLPPQCASFTDDDDFVAWVTVAAIAEAYGQFDVAWELIEQLQWILRHGESNESVQARLAFLWARRGRIARTAGRLLDAEECYREALSISARAKSLATWGDARPHAHLGLAILAVGKGNYPQALRAANAVVNASSLVPTLYQVQAHLLLALLFRKRHAAFAALEHLWLAFDLLEAGDVRRLDILVSLAEVASEQGNHDAALRARLIALANPLVPRVEAAALAGLLDVASREDVGSQSEREARIMGSSWGQRVLAPREETTVYERLVSYTTERVESPDNAFTPHDVVLLAFGLCRIARSMGDTELDLRWLSRAEALAQAHGFHEREFEAHSLREDGSLKAAIRRSPHSSPKFRSGGTRASWARFETLEEPSQVGSARVPTR